MENVIGNNTKTTTYRIYGDTNRYEDNEDVVFMLRGYWR
jgi:hypothetical protein